MPRIRTRESDAAGTAGVASFPAEASAGGASLPLDATVELEARLHELFAQVEELRQKMSDLRAPAEAPEPPAAPPVRFQKLPVPVQRPRTRTRSVLRRSPARGPNLDPSSPPSGATVEPRSDTSALPPPDTGAPFEEPTDLQVEVETLNWMLELSRTQATADQAALNAQIDSLRQEQTALEAACAALRAERDAAQAGLRCAESAAQEHLRECERQQRTLDELQSRLAELESASATTAGEPTGEQRAQLDAALAAAQAREADLQRAVDELSRSLDQERTRSSTAREDMERAIHSRQITEAELVQLRERLADLHMRLQTEAQRHLGQMAESVARLQGEQRQRAELNEELEHRGQESLKLREDLAQLRDSFAQADADRTELQREAKHLRRELEAERRRNDLVRLHARLDAVAWTHPLAVRPETQPEAEPAATTRGLPPPAADPAASRPTAPEPTRIVAIGASTGGPAVLEEILPVLPAEFPACLLIVQHMPPGYTAELASRLNQRAAITVREARHGDSLCPGTALIAPGGHHMELHDGTIRLSQATPVNNVRPSVDVLFDSLLPVARRVQAVLLTGMGSDGATAMGRLRSAGAETIVQDQSSSVIWGMPGAAVKAGAAVLQMPPAKLGHYLVRRIASASATRPIRREPPREIQAAAAG